MNDRLNPETVRQNLQTIIDEQKDYDYSSVSHYLGKNAAYIQQYIKRGIPKFLKEDDRHKLAELFGVSEWLLGGPSYNISASTYSGFSEEQYSPMHNVPYYDARASAGNGAFVQQDIIEKVIPFQINWLKSLGGQNIDQLSIIRVSGDSMVPTLCDGDEIMVDLCHNTPGRQGIYVIRMDETLLVKRITIDHNKGLLNIISDNPIFESHYDVKPSNVTVLGRVLWAGKKL